MKDIHALVRRALEEDAYKNDLTSKSVASAARATGIILAEEDLVVSGIEAAVTAFRLCDPSVRVAVSRRDGQSALSGRKLLRVSGRARGILAAERTALNFLTHLCGIATLTRRFVRSLPGGSRTKILDTRKTTPLLRSLEKAAVRHGGGFNHRKSLAEAVLLKDNHVALIGGVARAVLSARAACGRHPIEVEVCNLKELQEALASGADRVLLDNMTDSQIRRAVKEVGGRIPIEVSGGVTADRIRGLANLGVDFISIGALTHSAPSARLSMDLRPM